MAEEVLKKARKYFKSHPDNNQGFTLIEVMASLAIISMLLVGTYGLIMMSLRVTSDNSSIVQATEIANQRMERIRNLPYDDVGTVSGSPSGVIPEDEKIVRNGVYNVHTMIVFYDDPYDGTMASGTDSIFVDYKIATIDVGWQGKFGSKKITVFSKIVPNTEETLTGYGLMKLITVDASGAVVPNADIHIENASTSVNADYISDANGQFYNAFLPSFEGYEVTVSKAGYATEKTYARVAPNLNPTKPNLSIFDGAKTEESFSIDHLANFTIRTVSDNLPDNWLVNASTSNDSLSTDLSSDQNDNLYFVWQNNGPATSTVYLQKYNSTNVKDWADDVAISNTSFQVNPGLATTKTGLSYVVWQDDSSGLKALAYQTKGNIIKVAKNRRPAYSVKDKIEKIVRSSVASLFSNISSWWRSLIAFSIKESKTPTAKALSGVTIVQTKISSAVSGSNSITASFDAPPTAGNVLIAIAVHSNASRAFSAPTNTAGTFTVSRYSNSAWALDTGIWHKVAGAGEPSSVTITSSGTINGGVLMLMEVSGLDTADLLDVAAANDQTGSTGVTANTGLTAVSADNGFAVAASAFADNDFNTPTSANWTSASTDSWTHQLWTDWTTGNDGSLAVATMDIDTAAAQRATLALTVGGNEERNSVIAVFHALPLNQAIVGTAGSQNTEVVVPQTDYYLGGKFVVTENSSSRNVNSVKLQENGTVNAQTAISAVKLFYDLDTSAPYDCASETYNSGTDAEFGSSATFDGTDGYAQITQAGGVNITTTKTLCLYPVLSITGAINNDTLDLRIDNPTTDVVLSVGSSTPASAIEISGSTLLKTPSDVRQAHTRLRSDDGDETAAGWKNSQDTPGTIYLNEKLRLRFEMTNRGGTSSPAFAYRLEYGELATDCDSISAWQAVPNDNSLDWKTADSSYFTDADPSTNVANGLTDENLDFAAGELKDTGNQTAPLALDYDNFTEIEYSVTPTASAGDKSFCFRLTDQGDASAISYENYAVVSIKGDENIFIRAVDATGAFSWPTKRVNAELGDSHQTKPIIALTENSGTATTAVAWEDNRNGESDIYLQILDKDGNRQLAADLQVSTSANPDHSPALAFDSLDNLYVVWVESGLNQDIYLSKFDLAGNLLLGPVALKNSADQETYPKIIFDGSDNPYLSYTLETDGIKNAALVKYDSLFTPIWENNPSADTSAVNRFDSRLSLYGSTMFAVWNDERNGDKDIYAQKIDASGSPLWTNDLKVNIGLDSADQLAPNLVVRSTLKAIAAWTDNRNSKSEIFATEFAGAGALTGVANVPLDITGTKRIGESPVIYKYNEVHTTDASGNLTLSLDWDVPGYSVSIHAASSSKTIILRDPPQPLNFMPADTKTMLIYVD
jgi:prepilin-type N-terminal cleavage/methylation domain-containing protein